MDFLGSAGVNGLWWSASGSALLFAAVVLIESMRQPAASTKSPPLPPWLDATLAVVGIVVAAVVVGFIMAFHHAIQHGH